MRGRRNKWEKKNSLLVGEQNARGKRGRRRKRNIGKEKQVGRTERN